MQLSSANLSFDISLIQIEELKPHEEIIPDAVHALTEEIRLQNEVRDPLIVDRHSLVILDGMHRHSSLKELGCHFAPCCLLDYDDPQIKVGSWYRVMTSNDPEKNVESVLEALHVDYSKKDSTSPKNVVVLTGMLFFQLNQTIDDFSKARLAVDIEKAMVQRGYEVRYVPDTIGDDLRMINANVVIPLPTFTKAAVRKIAITKRLLPHKATRHVIPSRPMRLDIPLELLIEKASTEDINKRVDALLATRHIDRRPPGSIVDGRQYQEELLVFSH
jgi:hypothetical protein